MARLEITLAGQVVAYLAGDERFELIKPSQIIPEQTIIDAIDNADGTITETVTIIPEQYIKPVFQRDTVATNADIQSRLPSLVFDGYTAIDVDPETYNDITIQEPNTRK